MSAPGGRFRVAAPGNRESMLRIWQIATGEQSPAKT
jgi:hypothetical protein